MNTNAINISSLAHVAPGCHLTSDAVIHDHAQVATQVVFGGDGIVVGQRARLDAACVIAQGVEIGRGAWVRCGAVVLQSVPPNAVVQGNPAQVVGYTRSLVEGQEQGRVPRHVSYEDYAHLERPSRIDLGVANSALYMMRKVEEDARGSLTVGEVPTEVPFEPKRYFAVYDVPSSELRGEHAHKKCEQFLICLHGSCRILLDNGRDLCEVTLSRPDMGVYMPAMVWGTQYRHSADAVLLVFASRPYENDDYLRTYEEFLSELNRVKS